MIVSHRRPSGDPVLEAFTDQTYAWLEEMEDDYERCMGEPFPGGSGILIGNDVLVALHHHEASWSRFDVADVERWILENAPGMAIALPAILADLCCFTNFLARTGRLDAARAIATERRFREVLEIAEPAPRNRAERRAAKARARRMN